MDPYIFENPLFLKTIEPPIKFTTLQFKISMISKKSLSFLRITAFDFKLATFVAKKKEFVSKIF